MRSTHAVTQRLAPRGSIRTRGSRFAASARLLTAGLVAVGSMTALLVAESVPASASTVNGIASIADPITLNVVTSGASTTPFTVSLPAQASCDGDTATHGYHVYSYLVPSGTSLSGVTFESFPSTGYGLVDNIGTYYGPVNTAIGTGQIVSVPNNFQWAPLVANDGVPLSTLLYTGTGTSASGIWEAGLVCANNSGVVADNWNTEVTFHAASTDPNGFTWTAVPGPSGSSPAAFTSASSTTFTQGYAGSFTPTASGSPTPAITESGALPAGVTFSGGALSGTPTASGTFPITLTATNGIESAAKQTFTLTVATAIPTVTGIVPSAGPTAGGTSVVITGTDLDSATTVDFGTTPATITADTATSITATAPAAGAGPVDVTVTTPGGTSATSGADLFTYGIVPVFTSATSATFVTNTAGTFTPAASGNPTPTITESGTLPGGVTFVGGVLSGTPTATGSFPVTFTATNGIGAPVTQSFTLTVAGFEITTTALPDAVVGTAYSQPLATAGSPTGATVTWKKVALPKGFTLSASGVLSGTPSSKTTGPQSVHVSVTDTKGGTPVTATIPLTIDEAPAFAKTSPVLGEVTEGSPASITVSATGYPAASYTLTGPLPTGLSFDQTTGVLSGTPTVTTDSSQDVLTIQASNGIGTPASETFTLSVYAPLAVTTTPLTIARGALPPTGFQLATVTGTEVGGTVKVKATGLPKGLSLSSAGVLSGTVSTKDAAQAYTVTITATSKDGKTSVTATTSATITVTS